MSSNEQLQLESFENLCIQFYTSPTASERIKAEKQLENMVPTYLSGTKSAPELTTLFNTIRWVEYLLLNSTSDYARFFASSRLLTLSNAFFNLIEIEAKIHLRNMVLDTLVRRLDFPEYVKMKLMAVFTTITKLGWFEAEVFRDIYGVMSKFLEFGPEQLSVGFQLLTVLVEDLPKNVPYAPFRNTIKERRTVVEFKDSQLLDIFTLAVDKLRFMATLEQGQLNSPVVLKSVSSLLNLLKTILGFDFIGTNNDESGEDTGFSQFPTSWKSTFLKEGFISVFFNLYKRLPLPQSSQVLSCLVFIASTRRALFSEDEGRDFVLNIIGEVTGLLVSGYGLDESSNHHELCRVLSRFRYTYQLSDINDTSIYWDWIKALNAFTRGTINNWEKFPNSMMYLMSVWVKIVSSSWNLVQPTNMTFQSDMHLLPTQVFHSFLESRLNFVELSVKGDTVYDDMLEEMEPLTDALESIATIARYRYQISKDLLMNAINLTLAEYQEAMIACQAAITTHESVKNATDLLSIAEGKLTWIVYTVGALLSGRISYMSTEEDDLVDADLSAKVFDIVKENHKSILQFSKIVVSCHSVHLSFAILYFFSKYQASYIGEMTYRSSSVYNRLSEIVGINSSTMVLELIVDRINLNLERMWFDNDQLITQSIALLYKLAEGYNPSKLLRNLDQVKFLMDHHGPYHFPFMNHIRNHKNRTILYSALTKILVGGEDLEVMFAKFVVNFEVSFRDLAALESRHQYLQDTVKFAVSGLARDLQGILTSCSNRKSFSIFFPWYFSNYNPLLCQICQVYTEDSENNDSLLALTSLLKFFNELVLNRSQRLIFPTASADTLILFKQLSPVLIGVAKKIVDWEDARCLEEGRIKILQLWLKMLSRILSGGYVCFGVFKLYQDPCLTDLLQQYFAILLKVPLAKIHAFPKIQKVYYELVEMFISEHLIGLNHLDSKVFLALNRILIDGVQKLEVPLVITSTCRSVDFIATFLFEAFQQRKLDHYLTKLYDQHSEILPHLFETIFNVILFDKVASCWSHSRPLLGLLNINPQFYSEYTTRVLQHQVPPTRANLEQALTQLMDGVNQNLSSGNRELFTQRLGTFLREVAGTSITLIPVQPSPLLLMSSMSL